MKKSKSKNKANLDKKKKEEKLSRRKQKELAEKELFMESLLEVVSFDEELGVGIMRDGSIIDCFEILCYDLQNESDAETNLKMLTWEKLFSVYGDDIKIISSFFPVSTNKQVEYLKNILDRTENPLYRELVKSRIADLEWIHENYVNRNYLLFFYSKNLTEYQEHYTRIIVTLNSYDNLVAPLSNDIKKEQIFLLHNKNLNF